MDWKQLIRPMSMREVWPYSLTIALAVFAAYLLWG
jgi:hypothetical protein